MFERNLVTGIGVALALLGLGAFGLVERHGDKLLNIYAQKNHLEPLQEVTQIEKIIVQSTSEPIEPKVAVAISSLFIHKYSQHDKIMHLATMAVRKGEPVLVLPVSKASDTKAFGTLKVCASSHWLDDSLRMDCSDSIEYNENNMLGTLLNSNTPFTIHIEKDIIRIVPNIEVRLKLK